MTVPKNDPAASPAPLLKLETWAGFVKRIPKKRKFTIQGVLPLYGLCICNGRGKAGKSTLCVHVMRAVALGEPFLGLPTRKRPVVLVNYENPADHLRTLLATQPTPQSAYLIERPESQLTLATLRRIMARVGKRGVLVIDSFRGAFKLKADLENSASGAGLKLRRLQELAVSKRWVIIVIHHNNRRANNAADAISGTSDFIAAPDVIWSWSRADPSQPGTLAIEGRIPPVTAMRVRLTPERIEYLGNASESTTIDQMNLILGLQTRKWMPTAEVAKAAGLAEGTTRARLRALLRAKLVERKGTGKRNNTFLWRKAEGE